MFQVYGQKVFGPPFIPLSHRGRFQGAWGKVHMLFPRLTEALFPHKQPHTPYNNKPESFSVPSLVPALKFEQTGLKRLYSSIFLMAQPRLWRDYSQPPSVSV